MAVPTVAILAPGDMGHATGAVLRRGGVRVITNLAGRSSRTADFAKTAGIEPVADDQILVRDADILLSIAPPGEAVGIARRIAAALAATKATLLYVDCNAISPDTSREIGAIVSEAGAVYVDAGIIGPPPKPGENRTRFYVAGPQAAAAAAAALGAYGLDIRIVDGGIGAASALKMCYAATTKGMQALATQALVAAETLGVTDALRAEFAISRANFLAEIESGLPKVPAKAYRWVAEMEEIAATFAGVGLGPEVFEGIAEIYRLVADSARHSRTVEDYVSALSAATASRKSAAE
jgi:3-hydroxyisobutyrate dehydrogenase-like beta-hydroxyacid dehydrogenase